jgi:hypothetical protein
VDLIDRASSIRDHRDNVVHCRWSAIVQNKKQRSSDRLTATSFRLSSAPPVREKPFTAQRMQKIASDISKIGRDLVVFNYKYIQLLPPLPRGTYDLRAR